MPVLSFTDLKNLIINESEFWMPRELSLETQSFQVTPVGTSIGL